jgi:hypothetical protein
LPSSDDRNTHVAISGAVDEIAVGVGLKIAAAGIVRNAGKVERSTVRWTLHREETVAVAMLVATVVVETVPWW